MSSEPVFLARNAAEEAAVEDVLKAAGIAYSVTTEAAEKPDSAVCFLAMVYQVANTDAARARKLLEAGGLRGGILSADG